MDFYLVWLYFIGANFGNATGSPFVAVIECIVFAGSRAENRGVCRDGLYVDTSDWSEENLSNHFLEFHTKTQKSN